MRFTGILGIIALLGIAYLMSNNKRQIRVRIIVWGMSLQILFAAIILGKSTLSYSAMFVFILLIIFYIFKDYIGAVQSRSQELIRSAKLLFGAIVSAAVFYLLSLIDAAILPLLFWLIFLGIVLKAVFKIVKYQQVMISGLLSSAYIWLITNEFTGRKLFKILSQKVARFLSLSDLGAEFMFGNLALKKYFFTDGSTWPGYGFQFAFTVLPVIIFFASFMSILYHLGLMQKIISAMAKFMQWTMGTSGAETLSCTANIFVGQTEAPLLIRPFLEEMTSSELLTVMVGGFATIAGGVLAGYIAMGIDAGHLIAASVMAAPAGMVVSKIIFPETEHSGTAGGVKIPKDMIKSSNLLDAASQGVSDGLKLAVNVGAMLIAFIALIGLVDMILSFADRLIDGKLLGGEFNNYSIISSMSPVHGEYAGIFPGSIKTIFGTLLRPLAWLMGVSWKNALEVGNLLGIKLALTEFVAYGSLAELIADNAISEKAIVISTYALCGFANFASIGIQIGGISALVPSRRTVLSKVALKAMFGGAIATCLTASIAGILY